MARDSGPGPGMILDCVEECPFWGDPEWRHMIRGRGLSAPLRPKRGAASEKALLRQLFDNVPAEDIEAYGAHDLAELARGRLAFLAERRPGRAKISVTNPDGAFADVTFIDIANDDMPFLVDFGPGPPERDETSKSVWRFIRSWPSSATRRQARDGSPTNRRRCPMRCARALIHIHLARIGARGGTPELEEELRRHPRRCPDRGARLARHAAAAQGGDFSLPDRAAADPDRGTDQVDRLSCSGCSTIISPSSACANTPSKAAPRTGELKPVPIPGSACCANPTRRSCSARRQAQRDHAGDPRIPDAAGGPHHHQVGYALDRPPPRPAGLYRRQAVRSRRRTSRASCAWSACSPRPPIPRAPTTSRCLRRKIARVVAASGFSPTGHSGKALITILEDFPRDELFQIDAETSRGDGAWHSCRL